MDGTGARDLAQVEGRSVGGLSVHHKTALVYWTAQLGFFRCDIHGNNIQRLNLSPRKIPFAIAAAGKVIYWLEKEGSKVVISRASVGDEKAEHLFVGELDLKDMEIQSPEAVDSSIANPCASHPCSQICVQSSQQKHFCLCADDFFFESDGHTCSGNYLSHSATISV